MKRLLIIMLLVIGGNIPAQQRLLTKKIVYTVPFTDSKVKSSMDKDSVIYDYKVNKRFFWEATDGLISDLKTKKVYLTSFNGDTLNWDTVINNLSRRLNASDRRNYGKKEIEQVLENEIRAVKFMEEWTYNQETMMIDKLITAFCPVIQRDSVTLADEDLQTTPSFSFDLGWIQQNNKAIPEDTVLIARNIQYTMGIYNAKPYHWWDNNLEAEYSVTFFDMLFEKTQNLQVLCYDNPDAVEPFTKNELEKRKRHSVTTTVYSEEREGNVSETDTSVILTYTSEDIDHLRFGEQLYYDKKHHNFIKQVNYYAPVIKIYTSSKQFMGYYPLFYIRRK